MNNSLAYEIGQLILNNGKDILSSPGMESEKSQRQHGHITCFEHSVAVAYVSVWLTIRFSLTVDIRRLIRGALLHDYFLYDWHDRNKSHKMHGFTHAKVALENADRDFILSPVEKDIIVRHMFPLNILPPKYKESVIVCLADKLCAGLEIASIVLPIPVPGRKIRRDLS